MAIPAQTKYLFLIVLFVVASINFTRTTLEIIENSKRLDGLSQEVDDLEQKKTQLEESVAYKSTDDYIEEKARNDLSLVRPGEKVYVIPKELTESVASENVLGEKTDKTPYFLTENDDESNLKKWLKLFTH
ncbi:septum formation initiator family protein [Patescibacteria group bacterium]